MCFRPAGHCITFPNRHCRLPNFQLPNSSSPGIASGGNRLYRPVAQVRRSSGFHSLTNRALRSPRAYWADPCPPALAPICSGQRVCTSLLPRCHEAHGRHPCLARLLKLCSRDWASRKCPALVVRSSRRMHLPSRLTSEVMIARLSLLEGGLHGI